MNWWDIIKNPHKYQVPPSDWLLRAITYLPGHRVYKDKYPNIPGAKERPTRNRKTMPKRSIPDYFATGPGRYKIRTMSNAKLGYKVGATRHLATNALMDYAAAKTSAKLIRPRRPHKKASKAAFIKRFFEHRMPILKLRTYPSTSFEITCLSATQGVYPSTMTQDSIILDKKFCSNILLKMQTDMAVPSGNTPGDGVVENATGGDNLAQNMLRNGLTFLNVNRTYHIMNTVNAIAFVEVYELVWKGQDFTYGAGTLQSGMNPRTLWNDDVQHGDNPVWHTSIAWPTDQNVTVTSPGVRPNRYSKALWKFWALEKKTKYTVKGGQSITHSVNIPALYVSPEESNMQNQENPIDWNDLIAGKSRAIMIIYHGQLGFSGAAGTTNIEYVPVHLNVRWRQLTTVRITEHGQKKYQMYTGCHDFTTNVAEHSALTNPTVMVMDPMDTVVVADQDT